MMYSQDYDEHMPYSFNYYVHGSDSASSTLVWWEDVTQPYVKSYQLVICPSDSPPTSYTYGRSGLAAMGYPTTLLTSYTANESVIATTTGSSAPTALASFVEPATTIIVTDCTTTEISASTSDAQTTNTSRVDKRHLDGANFVFADGHVKWLKQTQASMWTIAAD